MIFFVVLLCIFTGTDSLRERFEPGISPKYAHGIIAIAISNFCRIDKQFKMIICLLHLKTTEEHKAIIEVKP